jgi:hypothetical protein
VLRQRHTDFLIGEEPLDGDVGFFAASADAGPPAAADPIAETTPGLQVGPFPAGRRPGRGSAIPFPRLAVSTRQLAFGLLVASCASVAVIVALGLPTKPEDARPRSASVGKPATPDRGSGREVEHRRRLSSAHRGEASVAGVGGWGAARAVPVGSRSRPAGRARRPDIAEPTGLGPGAAAAADPFSTAAGETSEVAQTAGAGESRSEFDFER